ncbi:lactate/malate family dehydrogenase [Streptomyces sp. TRM49041]|uniref:lactate/malate family dehydrogenase n=1 Tax=Streptomyces sp. TRM49041 TaxID=2603216 RepID=UPI0021CCAA03|nr:hypothetical protein [Streptomyces sp. TRM49041]
MYRALPSTGDVFDYLAGHIEQAALSLWPDAGINLGSHIPSVTAYVRRIEVDGRPLVAKVSFLGMSLASVLRGAGGDWAQARACQAAYTSTPGGLLERETIQYGILHTARLRAPRIAGYTSGTLFTEPVAGPNLGDLLLNEPFRTAELLDQVVGELVLLEHAQATVLVVAAAIPERSVPATFSRKFNSIGAPSFAALTGPSEPVLSIVVSRLLRARSSLKPGSNVIFGDLKPEHVIFPDGGDGRPVFLDPGMSLGHPCADYGKLLSRLVLGLLAKPCEIMVLRTVLKGVDRFVDMLTDVMPHVERDRWLRQQHPDHLPDCTARPAPPGYGPRRHRAGRGSVHAAGLPHLRAPFGRGRRHGVAARPGPRCDGGPAMTGPRKSVGIIGAGAVGHTVATLLTAAAPWCERLLVASGTTASAEALVADVEDMAEVIGSPVRAETADVTAMAGCEAVVICPRARFTNTRSQEVRMAGLAASAPLIAALGRQLAGYTGTAIMVTNPVDVLTRVFTETSGADRVYGVGSATDSARYRLVLARLLDVPAGVVRGRVIGEHGDGAVVCVSSTRVAGLAAPVPLAAVHAELKARPQQISKGLGRARSGPAAAVLAALTAALGMTDTVVELAVVNPDGSCLGIPLRFTGGVPTVAMPHLTRAEQHLLQAADRKIRAAYERITHHDEGAHQP